MRKISDSRCRASVPSRFSLMTANPTSNVVAPWLRHVEHRVEIGAKHGIPIDLVEFFEARVPVMPALLIRMRGKAGVQCESRIAHARLINSITNYNTQLPYSMIRNYVACPPGASAGFYGADNDPPTKVISRTA